MQNIMHGCKLPQKPDQSFKATLQRESPLNSFLGTGIIWMDVLDENLDLGYHSPWRKDLESYDFCPIISVSHEICWEKS